jgi:branched-chain amino acid transport system substrate-binding protein
MWKSRKTRSILTGAVALALVSSFGFSSGSPKKATGTTNQLNLGSLLTVTGDQGILGVSLVGGVQQAVDEINQSGGVLNNPVQLTNEDTGGDPQLAATAFSSLQSAGVTAIVGTDSSSVNLALIPKLSSTDGPFMCAPATTSPKLTKPGTKMFVRTSPSDSLAGKAFAAQLTDDGHSRLAILALNLDYGQGYAGALKKNFESAGGKVVANVGLDPAGTSFASEVSQALESNPDAIALITFPDTGGAILRELATQGAGPQAKPTYTGDGLQVPDLYTLVNPGDPTSTQGIKQVIVTAPEETSPFVSKFLAANPNQPLTYAPQAYDCAVMIALAADLGKSASASSIRKNFPNVLARSGKECKTYADCASLIADGAKKIKYSGASASQFRYQGNADLAAGLFSIVEYGADGSPSPAANLNVGRKP